MYKQLRFLTTMLLLAVCCGTWADDTYVKVTSTDDLVVGDVYLIAQTGTTNYVANGYSSGKLTVTSSGFTLSGNTITMTTATPITFVLGGTSDGYSLLINDGNGKYLGWNTKTNFRNTATTDSDDKEKWTITQYGSTTTYIIKNVSDNTRYISDGTSSGSTVFAPMSTSNDFGEADICSLYRKVTNTVSSPLASISIFGTYPTTFRVGDTFSHEGMTVTATYEDATTKDVTANSTFSGYDMSTIGSQTVIVSYTEGEVTKTATYAITVEAIPTHTATFSINGQTTSQDFEEGADIEFPDVDDQADYTFLGWSTSAISGTSATAPSTLVNSATMGMNDITYYAVYAIVTPGTIATATDVLNRATTGVTGTSYTAWSGKTATSTAVYAGQSAGGNESIQLRSTSPSGIVATTSGGNAKKVTVAWNSNTANGRTLDVYGKSTAYEASSELYNSSNQGTKLGSIVYGTSTELSITGDYAYIGLRSNDGAMYLTSISIEWENGTPATYSNYCTTIPTPTITVEDATVSVDAAEHEGTLAISIENMTITSTEDLGIQFYDAEGAELSSENGPDWIEVLVAEQDPNVGEGYVVSYLVEQNYSEARTAYFKVFAIVSDNFVYSNPVTISQAAAPTATITLNAACTDGDMVYGTFSCTSPFIVSDDIVVSEVGIVDGKLYVEAYETGAVVPASTGVMVSALEGGDYDVVLSSTSGISVLGNDNCLRATGAEGISATEMAAADTDCLYYRLTMHGGTKIGYWWGAADGAAFAVAANKAYLAVPETQAKSMGFEFGQDGDATSIPTIDNGQLTMENAYNLQGQKVGSAYRGIVIVNGKARINK